jgi:hypothetical protein
VAWQEWLPFWTLPRRDGRHFLDFAKSYFNTDQHNLAFYGPCKSGSLSGLCRGVMAAIFLDSAKSYFNTEYDQHNLAFCCPARVEALLDSAAA